MKISNHLPQFENNLTLFIVAGKQEAAFYLAENGEINKTASFKVAKPIYTDSKAIGGRGNAAYRAVAKAEKEKKSISADFMKEFKSALKILSAENSLSAVYIFCPPTEKASAQAALPAKLKTKLKMLKTGNFTKEHPFKLLEKLKLQ